MSPLRRLSRPGWLGLGLILGAILVPAGAIAATATLVSINGNGHTAYVTPAHQLRTAEADPSSFFHTALSASFVGLDAGCIDLGSLSDTRALVIKQVNVDVLQVGTMAQHAVEIYSDAGCSALLAGASVAGPDTKSNSLGSGVTMPAGTHLSVYTKDVDYRASVIGYTVTSSAASASSPAAPRRIVVTAPKR